MTTRIRLTDNDAARAPFQLTIGDRVRSADNHAFEGTVAQGTFEGTVPAGFYDIVYEVRLANDQSFSSREQNLEVFREGEWVPIFRQEPD